MIACVTTGTGYFKEGIPCELVNASERTVYLGPTGMVVKTTLPEFTLRFTNGKKVTEREYCQYGRDFVFAVKGY